MNIFLAFIHQLTVSASTNQEADIVNIFADKLAIRYLHLNLFDPVH